MKKMMLRTATLAAMTLLIANCAPQSNSGESTENTAQENQSLDIAGFKTLPDEKRKNPTPVDPLRDTKIYKKCEDAAIKKYPEISEAIKVCGTERARARNEYVRGIVGEKFDKSTATQAELNRLYAAQQDSVKVQNEVLRLCYARLEVSLSDLDKFGSAITKCTGF